LVVSELLLDLRVEGRGERVTLAGQIQLTIAIVGVYALRLLPPEAFQAAPYQANPLGQPTLLFLFRWGSVDISIDYDI
jgi:hypothetical protein